MSDEEGESEESTTTSGSTTTSDDDDDELIKENPLEIDFLKTLSRLKNKDPQIYDKNVQFFPPEDEQTTVVSKKNRSKKEMDKPMYLKDYERDILAKNCFMIDDNDVEQPPMTYNEEQKALKESFKNVVCEDSSDDENNCALLKKKEKGDKEKEDEEKDYIQWLKGKKEELDDKGFETELKPLHDYWNNPKLDEREQFLKDYILNKRYLERDSQGNYNGSDLSEDEELLEMQEDFEHRYNSRFHDDDNTTLKRYPRNVEGSLRRKNDARKRKREKIKERKQAEKEKKKLEIKKKQKEKLEEVKEKLSKLKEITGNAELAFDYDEIMEDFDPEKHDQKMQQLYNEQFYLEKTEEKPDFSGCEGDEVWNVEDINMDCEAELGAEQSKETRSKKKRKKKKAAFTDICDVVKPVFDPEKHRSFQKYIDEFYNLDCEDFIDDIPCRFKYRETVPNDYGLSVEEILLADDKELNRWVSAKKIYKLRPKHVEKNEVKIYKEKSKDDHLKRKLLPSLYNTENKPETDGEKEEVAEDDEEQHVLPENTTITVEEDKKKSKSKRKSKKSNSVSASTAVDLQSNAEPPAKKKRKLNREAGKSNKPLSGISDNRLLAYNIKPKQFKAKLKHSKQ